MNLKSASLTLYQFRDTQRLNNTLALLQFFDPLEILLPDNALSSNTQSAIASEFPLVPIQSIRRKYFNEIHGAKLLQEYATPASIAAIQLDSTLFLATAAAAALLQYIEFVQSIAFAPRSIKVSLKALEGHMRLDISTVRNLEILAPLSSVNVRSGQRGRGSLLGMLQPSVKSKMGQRLLRTTLLQPSVDIPTLLMRQESVQRFLEDERLFFDTAKLLSQMPDLEHLIAQFSQIPKCTTERTVMNQLQNFLLLRRSMMLVQELRKVLAKCKNPSLLLSTIDGILRDPIVEIILDTLSEVLQKDASLSLKGSSEHIRSQLVFGIKTGVSGVLDVARATFVESIDDIHAAFNRYKTEDPSIASAKLAFNVARGYHLSIPSNSLQLADIFIQRVVSGRSLLFSTEELISLDDRRKESFSEVMLTTSHVIAGVLQTIHARAHELIAISEGLAFLDLIRGFADYVTVSNAAVCPQLAEASPLAIKGMLHPIKEKMLENGIFSANSIFCDSVSILFGANASGKSTHLGSIALNVILAQCGCFVPADIAVIPIVDVLVAVLAQDCVDQSSGSFFAEMRHTAFALSNVTSRSLVLFDELGRSTSSSDGASIGIAVCEDLLLRPACKVMFVTHDPTLLDLQTLYPMSTKALIAHKSDDAEADDNDRAKFRVQALESRAALDHSYGISVAEAAGFPLSLTQRARALAGHLRFVYSQRAPPAEEMLRADVLRRLSALKSSSLEPAALKQYAARSTIVSFLSDM